MLTSSQVKKSWKPYTLGYPIPLKPEPGQVLGHGKVGIVQSLHKTPELLQQLAKMKPEGQTAL